MDYELTVGTKAVGKAHTYEEGLYLHIYCRAQLKGGGMYRLAAMIDGRRESIGILAPVGDGYGLERKIPLKRLQGESLRFQLVPAHEKMEGRFIPISPQEPFSYLEVLKDAYMEKRKDQVGVVIPEKSLEECI